MQAELYVTFFCVYTSNRQLEVISSKFQEGNRKIKVSVYYLPN